MLEIKNTIIEMKNIFDRFIHALYTAKKRINKHEDISIETSKTKIWREQKDLADYLRTVEQLQKI